jgi:hypothetical protein
MHGKQNIIGRGVIRGVGTLALSQHSAHLVTSIKKVIPS